MGVKALVYFEVVTTLALLIGWAAITISRAASASPAAPVGASQLPAAAAHVAGVILHIFPENIAKAVATARCCSRGVQRALRIALAMLPEERAADARASPRASPRRCSSSPAS
jgi:proton glutamate symport protein